MDIPAHNDHDAAADAPDPDVFDAVGEHDTADFNPDEDVDGDGGVVGSSMLSRSPSMGTLSSSVEGKKLRNSCSACHFDAFLNSIHTSIRPGRDSAGSRRSRWLVVLCT